MNKREVVESIVKFYDRVHEFITFWRVGGGASQVLLGIDETTDNIEINTSAKIAYAIGEILEPFTVKPVIFTSKGNICGHFGVFKIKSSQFEIIGNLRIKGELGTYIEDFNERFLKNCTKMEIKGRSIYITPLEEIFLINIILKKWGKAKKIVNFWKNHTELFNKEYLEERAKETFKSKFKVLAKRKIFRDIFLLK
ncbi:MAG: hypothetical protein ACTSSP_05255 [Candidatus Asgardarchaeia archaeon]